MQDTNLVRPLIVGVIVVSTSDVQLGHCILVEPGFRMAKMGHLTVKWA
jgi:hypothetical protein